MLINKHFNFETMMTLFMQMVKSCVIWAVKIMQIPSKIEKKYHLNANTQWQAIGQVKVISLKDGCLPRFKHTQYTFAGLKAKTIIQAAFNSSL